LLSKSLHIVSLNVPYPVDYGGVFDLFYKLPALQQQGIKIHLHCFEYGRGKQDELNKYCESISYYPRKKGLPALSIRSPYIVSSRSSKVLVNRLLEDDFPILMEGVHCTSILLDKRFESRGYFVRLHNVEFVYYRHLAAFTTSFFKKIYYNVESRLLSEYERRIANRATFLTVSKKDEETYKSIGCTKSVFIPLFLPDWKVSNIEGKGSFCLYHGDLSVAENEKAALWLLKDVFNAVNIPFVIAGKKPSKKLQKLAHTHSNVCLIANPDEAEMQDLIAKAHINIIPSYNSTGVKLKLINALYNGRYCLVNETTILASGLEEACVVASNANSFKLAIEHLYSKPFYLEELQFREQLLSKTFNNTQNARQLISLIWNNS
jgi:hypothetical protein